MRNKKVPSMVAVGVSLMMVGYIGAKQIDSVDHSKKTEKVTVAAYNSETQPMIGIERREQSIVAMAMQDQMMKDAMGITTPETETQIQPETETQTVDETTEQNTQQAQEETNTNTGSGGAESEIQTQEIALSDLLGKNLKVTYQGYSTTSSYQEGNYFSANASSGNTLIIMKINVKNTGKKNAKIDLLSKNVTFYGCFNGADYIMEKKILSTKNLSTYQGKVKPGKTIKNVLVFEVPKKQADEISTQDLQVEMDGQKYQVTM